MKDYHDILGVEPVATPEEIKRAYKKLVLQYHPDRNPHNSEATKKFMEATEAYETLIGKRKTPQQVYSGFNGIFNDFFTLDLQDLRRGLDDYVEHLKNKEESWPKERKKKREELSKRQKDLESIIGRNEQTQKTVSRRYQWPAAGAVLGSGILLYADQIEYGITAATVAGLLTFIAYLKKKTLKRELKYLRREYGTNTLKLENMKYF